jgi:hypothetical protein
MKIAHENCGGRWRIIENDDSASNGTSSGAPATAKSGQSGKWAKHWQGLPENLFKGENRRPEHESSSRQCKLRP